MVRRDLVRATRRVLALTCILVPSVIAGCEGNDDDPDDGEAHGSKDADSGEWADGARADAGAWPSLGDGQATTDAGTAPPEDAGGDGTSSADGGELLDASDDAALEPDAQAPSDAGADAGFDAGPDGELDAGADAGFDAGTQADAGAPPDAGAPVDAGTDSGSQPDASADAGTDSGSTVDAGPGCTVIPDLVAWWRGEDDANDELKTFNGSWVGGSPTYVAGKSGKAFSLNATGGGGFVSVPHTPALSLAIPFTVSVWINLAGNNLRVVDKITNGTGDGYLIDIVDSRQPRLISGPALLEAPPGTIAANTWHHLAAVVESTTMRRLYVDGVEVATRTADTPGPGTPNVPLRFGASSDGLNRFPGLVDEIALFGRALTPSEVAGIHARGSESLCR